jgi:hypothetical protein
LPKKCQAVVRVQTRLCGNGNRITSFEIQEEPHVIAVRFFRQIFFCPYYGGFAICLFNLPQKHIRAAKRAFKKLIASDSVSGRFATGRHDHHINAAFQQSRQ